MSSDLDLHGIYVPLVTPFRGDGSIAIEELKQLAVDAANDGAAGIVALGTTGEPATLRTEERTEVTAALRTICTERNLHLCVGAGTNDTRLAIENVSVAVENGADSVLVVSPYYTRPSEQGIVEHYKAIASASSVPVIVYNIPYRTGRGLGASSLLQLADVPNIAGVKQAVGGVDADTAIVLAQRRDDFFVLCGDDPYLYPLLCLGAKGAIGASANTCTAGFVELVRAHEAGDADLARRLHEALLPLTISLFSEPSPSVIKGVLHGMGRIPTARLRLPMTIASQSSVQAATSAMRTAKQHIDVLLEK